jgi:hypothetical protein
MSLLPPAISDMGTSSGFTYYLQDRGSKGYQALKRRRMISLRSQSESQLPMSILMELGEGAP